MFAASAAFVRSWDSVEGRRSGWLRRLSTTTGVYVDLREARDIVERSILLTTRSAVPAGSWSAADQQSLRDLGVTSLMLYQLASTVETVGELSLADEDVRADNFVTLGSVSAMLLSYERGARNGRPAP